MRLFRAVLLSLPIVLLELVNMPCEGIYAQAAQATAAAPTLQVYSRETVVDISVTDDKGNPVHGLTRDDFTILEDKKPQPVRSFQEFGSATAPPPRRKLPPNVYTNDEPPQTNPALNIILLDGLNTAPTDGTDPAQVSQSFIVQTRVRQGAHNYLANAPPGSRFAVLNLTSRLRILQGFTSDTALLSDSVDTMQMDMDGRAIAWQEGINPHDIIESWKSEQNSRNRATLEALNQIASDFINVKGKKNLFWFSTGSQTLVSQSMPAGIALPRSAGFAPPNYGLPDYSLDLHRTYALLQAAQITVYPIDGRSQGLDIERPYGGGILKVGDTDYTNATAAELLSFEQLAEDTGGKAFYNSNDLAGLLGKAVAAGSDYYTISYAPPGAAFDGRHHTIHVEVDKPRMHMTYRDQYWAEDPSLVKPKAELSLATTVNAAAGARVDGQTAMRTAMVRAMPLSSDLLFDAQVEPITLPAKPGDPAVFGTLDPKYKGKPLTRYAITFFLPGKELALADGANFTHWTDVEKDVTAWDGDAKLVNSNGASVKVALTSQVQVDALATSTVRYFEQIDLPAGALFLRIGLLDRTSGKIGTLEIPLTVAKK